MPCERFLAPLGMTALAPRPGRYPEWVQGYALVAPGQAMA